MLVLAVVAGTSLIGGTAAQAGPNRGCGRFPDVPDSSKRLVICSDVETYYGSSGQRIASGQGLVWIGSLWGTTATDCKITTWLSLATSSGGWNTPRQTGPCKAALDHRQQEVRGPKVTTGTTATQVHSWTCVDLYWNSTSSGWQRCTYSHVAYW